MFGARSSQTEGLGVPSSLDPFPTGRPVCLRAWGSSPRDSNTRPPTLRQILLTLGGHGRVMLIKSAPIATRPIPPGQSMHRPETRVCFLLIGSCDLRDPECVALLRPVSEATTTTAQQNRPMIWRPDPAPNTRGRRPRPEVNALPPNIRPLPRRVPVTCSGHLDGPPLSGQAHLQVDHQRCQTVALPGRVCGRVHGADDVMICEPVRHFVILEL